METNAYLCIQDLIYVCAFPDFACISFHVSREMLISVFLSFFTEGSTRTSFRILNVKLKKKSPRLASMCVCARPLAYTTTPWRGGGPPKRGVRWSLPPTARVWLPEHLQQSCKCLFAPDAWCEDPRPLAPLTGVALMPARMPSMQAQPVSTRQRPRAVT